MSRVFHDMPWPMLVYFGIGLVVAYWYQRREGHPERDHHARAQVFVLMILAWMWPILLLAVLPTCRTSLKAVKTIRHQAGRAV